MAKIKAKDLKRDEWDALKRYAQGGAVTFSISKDVAQRLHDLGLVEQKLGGIGISREGRRVVAEVVLAARRRRDE